MTLSKLRQTLASYLGHFKHADTYNLISSLWARHAWLSECFIFDHGKLYNRFRYAGVFRSLKAQATFFKARLGKETAFFLKVGKFYELFDYHALGFGVAMGLNPTKNQRGMSWVAGFPARFRQHYVEKALKAGVDFAVIEEDAHAPVSKAR